MILSFNHVCLAFFDLVTSFFKYVSPPWFLTLSSLFYLFLLVYVVPSLWSFADVPIVFFNLSFGLLDPPHWRHYVRKHIPGCSASSRPPPTSTTPVISCHKVSVLVKGMRLREIASQWVCLPKADNQRLWPWARHINQGRLKGVVSLIRVQIRPNVIHTKHKIRSYLMFCSFGEGF